MKIGIDAKVLCAKHATGLTNYAYNIFMELTSVMPDALLHFYAPSSHDTTRLRMFANSTILIRKCPSWASGNFWTKFMVSDMVRNDDIDVFVAPRTLYQRSIIENTPVVSIVHDMAHSVCPETMPVSYMLAERLWFAGDVKNATKVVCVSHGTSERMQAMFGRTADAIANPAVSATLSPSSYEDIGRTAEHYSIKQPYIMFAGNLERRKNIINLIRAVSIINSKTANNITLIIVGNRVKRNRELNVLLDTKIPNVIELGFVPDKALKDLYSGAEVFVMPSIYEGYGMPAAEARACGTRVVATDSPELREAGGPDAVYVEPTANGLATGILSVLYSARPKPSRSTNWRDSAKVLANVLVDATRR